jgi:hypothetical protein
VIIATGGSARPDRQPAHNRQRTSQREVHSLREGSYGEELKSSAVGVSRLDPRPAARCVAFCGRRGDTPETTFAEYVAHARAAATGRTLHQLFTGYLVAEAGQIKLLRESFNPLAMAQAQLPNGVADIEPPGDEVYAF